MKGKILIIVAALVLGGVAAWASYSYLGALQRQAEAGSAMTDVLVAKQDIPRGTPAKDLVTGGLAETTRMPQRYVAPGALAAVTSVADRIVAEPVLKGEVLTAARFQYPTEAGLAFTVPKGLVAVTIPVDDARGVSGLINPGDRVAVLGTVSKKTVADTQTRIMIPGVQVLAVGQSTGVDTGAREAESSSGGLVAATQSQPSGATKTITVAVSAADAERVVFAIETGSIWLALLPGETGAVARGAGQTAATVLK